MSEQPKTRPEWLSETGLVSVALPEPPLVRKYAGGQPLDVEQEYEESLSEKHLESLAAAGVTLVWVRFYSGFGLEFEKAEIERARDFIVRAQARGLRAAAALQFGLVVPETLLLEEPECHNWLQVNGDGRHVPVGRGAAGVRPCYNCEGFMRYMERVCLLAVDAGADLVHLENVGYNLEPDTCRCPLCVAAFRDFLRQQYGPQDEKTQLAGLARFGHNSFTHVRPPAMARDIASEVTSPHEQEWIRLKVHSLAACLGRLSRLISRRDPECAVGADLLGELGALSEGLYGISFPAHVPLVDLVKRPAAPRGNPSQDFLHAECIAETSEPDGAMDDPKAVVSAEIYLRSQAEASGLKMAGVFGAAAQVGAFPPCSCCLPQWKKEPTLVPLETRLALNLMFNRFGLGCLGEAGRESWFAPGWQERLAQDGNLRMLCAYLDFYASHKAALLGARSLAAVAIYHETAHEMFDPFGDTMESILFERRFEEEGWGCVPLYPNHFADASRFRCVVLGCSALLANETLQAVTRYVESGGGLVVADPTGVRDEWGRECGKPLLDKLLGPEYSGAGNPQPLQRQVGAGRVAAPAIWQNNEELLAAVSFAAGGPPPWSVESAVGARPLSWAVQSADGTLLLHVAAPTAPALPSGLRCSIACDKQPQRVLPCAPGREFAPVAFTWENGRAAFEFGAEAAGGQMPKYLMFRMEIGGA